MIFSQCNLQLWKIKRLEIVKQQDSETNYLKTSVGDIEFEVLKKTCNV